MFVFVNLCLWHLIKFFHQEGDGGNISLKDAAVFETSAKNTTHTFTVRKAPNDCQ